MDLMPAIFKAPATSANGQAAPAVSADNVTTPGAPANFLQLLAQLVGAAPVGANITTEVAVPELVAEPDKKDSHKTDSDTATTDNTSTDNAALSLLLPGLCTAPVPVATASVTTSDSAMPAGVEGVDSQKSNGTAQQLIATLTDGASADTASAADCAGLPTNLHSLFSKSTDMASCAAVPAHFGLPDAAVTLNKADSVAPDVASATSAVSGVTNPDVQASQLHAAAAAHARANGDAPPPTELRSPVGTPGWHDELGNQLTMMTHRGLDSASLKLSPEHLGPLEIRISMREGEASVWFGADNADTRSALDQALPKLKEMFASQGMVLADAGVFKEAPRQQYRPTAVANSVNANERSEPASATRVSSVRLRLLDTYV